MEGGFLDYLKHGGMAMYPLGLASILSVAIIIERFWTIRQSVRKVQEIRSKILGYLKRNQPDKALSACRLSPVGGMYEAVLTGDSRNEAKWTRSVERRRMDVLRSLRKNVWFLGTVGALAPFVGLFGTVLGIINSFRSIAITGSGGFSVVSAGISEALVATGAGLVVAIYSVFAYNYFSTKINNVGYRWKIDLEDLSDWVRDAGTTTHSKVAMGEQLGR
jgi:biopolymer transport protein ExbB